MIESLRNVFEAWAAGQPFFGYEAAGNTSGRGQFHRDGEGYADAVVHAAWMGFCEGAHFNHKGQILTILEQAELKRDAGQQVSFQSQMTPEAEHYLRTLAEASTEEALAKLENLAADATPGPWYSVVSGNSLDGSWRNVITHSGESVIDPSLIGRSNADYIAYANPVMVSAMIGYIRRLEAQVSNLKEFEGRASLAECLLDARVSTIASKQAVELLVLHCNCIPDVNHLEKFMQFISTAFNGELMVAIIGSDMRIEMLTDSDLAQVGLARVRH